MLRTRRQRVSLFSRLLLAERSDRCPRCLFARWLEYTQQRVTSRSIVTSSLRRRAAHLLGMCFFAWFNGRKGLRIDETVGGGGALAATGTAMVRGLHNQSVHAPPWCIRVHGGLLELRWAIEVDHWVVKVLRPEQHSQWVRRKSRWIRRRMLRLAADSLMRKLLLDARETNVARVQHEADLHYSLQSTGEATPSAYLAGATLRNHVHGGTHMARVVTLSIHLHLARHAS